MVLKERVESIVDVSEISAAEAHHWPIVRSFFTRRVIVVFIDDFHGFIKADCFAFFQSRWFGRMISWLISGYAIGMRLALH